MPCHRIWIILSAAAAGAVAPTTAALAQEPPGRTVGVIPDASALRSEGARPLAVQQPVYMGDRIQTGPRGEAQIHFLDTTRLVVGPASSLLIDSSVMRNRRTLKNFAVRALRGAFRFITGSSPKPAYSIMTPTATIGVRGTQFDFAVLPDGGTEFVLLHGGADVCDRYGNCIRVTRACDLISIPPSGPIRRVGEREERNARLRAYFPYVRNQFATLRQDFQANVASCGNITAIPNIPGSSPEQRAAQQQPAVSPPAPTPPSPPSPAPTPPAPAPTPPAPAPTPPAPAPGPAPAAPERPSSRPSPPEVAAPAPPAVSQPSPPSPGNPSKPGDTHSKPDHGPGKPDCCSGKHDHDKPDRHGGNPGNGKGVGKAGESPSGRDFGGGSRGRGDGRDRGGPVDHGPGKGDHHSRGHSGPNSPGIASGKDEHDRGFGPGTGGERGDARGGDHGGGRGRGDGGR